MAVNKVVYGETTVIDITDSTVTASNLKSGETAYGANGQKVTGTLVVPEVLDDLSDVVITTPQTAQEIYFDGTNWINYGAKIVLTFDDDFKGQTITLTKGQTTITKTAPLDSNTMNLYVNETGTWTISSTFSGDTYETEVNVTTFGTSFNAELVIGETVPQGSTVTPTDDIQIWLACANITDKSYTLLSEVLADRATFETLIADSNACDYMARSTTWANDVADDADAMALIGKYDYCSNALLSNDTWAEAIANSDYWDSVLQPLVPIMTSNTTPSGVASASSIMSSTYDAWRAFSGHEGMAWVANGSAPHWLAYTFPIQTQIIGFTFMTDTTADRQFSNYKVQGYNGESWEDIPGVSYSSTTTANTKYKYFFSQFYNYIGYRIYIGTQGTMAPLLKLVNFIGRASKEVLVPLVPTMTSNTTPSGECIANGYITSGAGFPPYQAFDKIIDSGTSVHCWAVTGTSGWLGYHFPRPVKVDQIILTQRTESGAGQNQNVKTATIQYSDDGTIWVDDANGIQTYSQAVANTVNVAENNAHAYWRVNVASIYNNTANAVAILELQFYQRTVQTNIIHSCANDTIYTYDEGSTVVLATTNSDGDGVLDFSSLEDKEYTFYSSVAKDPSNLSNDFSKTIRITKSEFGGTTEMYLMPDTVKTLYWFGYESSDLEEMSTANGWSNASGYSFKTPTYNTNSIAFVGASSKLSGVGMKSSVPIAMLYSVTNGTAGSYLADSATKTHASPHVISTNSSGVMAKFTSTVNGIRYAWTGASDSGSATCYALWYE